MKVTGFLAALLACIGVSNASAGDWLPTAGLRFSFGGSPAAQHFALELTSSYAGSGAAQPIAAAKISYDGGDSISGSLLGIPLRNEPGVLRADGESTGPSTWLWIGIGVAVTAAVVTQSGDDDTTGQSNRDPPSGCNGVGGDIPGQIIILGPDCEGVPGGGVRIPP